MHTQPQPPEPRVLHDVTDPASVIREADVAYGSGDDGGLTEATRNFLRELDSSGVSHLLVGAMAMLQHIDARPTRDIDLIIALADLDKIPGYQIDERNEWFATGAVGPVRVDLLFTENPFFAEILANHAESRVLLGTPIRCATPYGIILLKLYALPSLYRQGHVQRAAVYETDILRLLLHQPHDPEDLLKQLHPHMPATDISALRHVLEDIQQRIDRRNHF